MNRINLIYIIHTSRWNDFQLFIWIIDWAAIYALFLDIVPLISLPRSTIFEQHYCQQTTQYNPFFENCTGRSACKRFTRFQQAFCSSLQLHIVFMYEKMCEEHSKKLNVSTKWAENSLKDKRHNNACTGQATTRELILKAQGPTGIIQTQFNNIFWRPLLWILMYSTYIYI